MIRYIFPIWIPFFCLAAGAQDGGYLELVKAQDRLAALFTSLYDEESEDPGQVLGEIRAYMPEVLAMEGAMEFPWSGLTLIGVITSEDGQLRIFTWHVEDDADTYRYFGYIQLAQRRNRVKVFELTDNHKPQGNLSRVEQSLDNWYGKLYYQIVTTRHRRNTYYTLLGMDFNDSGSTIKTVEVMDIRFNSPRFRKGLISIGDEQLDRLVLEYSSTVAISVRYHPSANMITFDHIVPFHPVYKNNYQFYGPDGSYDGLYFEDGMWNYREDIDARNLD